MNQFTEKGLGKRNFDFFNITFSQEKKKHSHKSERLSPSIMHSSAYSHALQSKSSEQS